VTKSSSSSPANSQLDQLVVALREVLGDDLVGVYLHGSAALGGLKPSSDLDVIAVSGRRLAAVEKHSLALRLGGISKQPRSLDFDLVVHPEIRPWHYPPQFDFHYSEWWPGMRDRDTNTDLAVLITMLLRADTSLYGPAPGTVFDPVPEEDFRRTTLAAADEVVLDLEGDTRNVLLTLARIWASLETGDLLPKDRAATWALERLPDEHKPVLERARRLYLEGSYGTWDNVRDEAAALAAYTSKAIRIASTNSAPRR
jgi:predicted nucleotidyltransferase